MYRLFWVICPVLLLIWPETSFARRFKENDNHYYHNECGYVHKWFKMTKRRHAVFATTDGYNPFSKHKGPGICQAGGGDTMEEATRYALRRCEQAGIRHFHIHRKCKVIESR